MNLFNLRIEEELIANEHKGNWEEWKPLPCAWLWEMQYHIAKLQKAIKDKDKDLICEYSADIGNLAEKAFTAFGKPTECRVCDGKGELALAVGDDGKSFCSDCDGMGIIYRG